MHRPALAPPRVSHVALCALFSAACGPAARDAGPAAMLTAPLVFGCGVLAVWLLTYLWQRVKPEVAPQWELVGGVAIACALLSAVAVRAHLSPLTRGALLLGMQWIAPAFVSVALVSWRFVMSYAPQHAFFRAMAFTTGFVFLPAIYQRISGLPMPDGVTFFWVIPGYKWIVPAVLLAGLGFEAAQQRSPER